MKIADRLAGKRVFVTGADGFIGSHVVESLVRSGASVKALVLYNFQNSWGWLDSAADDVRGDFEVVSGDIRDGDFLRQEMVNSEIVLHLAALISIPYSYQAPASFIATNVQGTLCVLDAARSCGISRIVCTSTSEVYGTARYVPIDEAHPLSAQSPYAASKIAADQLALSYYRSFETPVVLLRPFNTYGPRQSARAVIPSIISQIATRDGVVELGSLHPTRDFSFVTDTAEAFLHAAVADGVCGEVINTGSGFEISIADTVARIGELMKVEAKVLRSGERVRPANSEVERLWADTGKAERLLGWSPAHAGREGFVRGLEKTIRWFRDERNLAKYKADRYNV